MKTETPDEGEAGSQRGESMKKLLAAAAIGLVSLVMGVGAAWADHPAAKGPPEQAVDHACGRRVDPHPPFCGAVRR